MTSTVAATVLTRTPSIDGFTDAYAVFTIVALFGRKRRDDPPFVTLRDILLASVSLEKVATVSHSLSPWSRFAAAHQALRNGDHHAAIQHLQKVVHMEGLEARVYLQAWHGLRELGE